MQTSKNFKGSCFFFVLLFNIMYNRY